jgi:hypothetical protein
LYITHGGTFINNLLPKNIQKDEQLQFFIVIARKLIVFVIIPYLIYRAFGFALKDFGLKVSLQKTFTKEKFTCIHRIISVHIVVPVFF